jgi:hypothetical protein
MSKNTIVLWIVVIVVILAGSIGWWYFNQPSGAQTTTQSSDKVINSFSFSGLNPEVDGVVDNTNYTVSLSVPSYTDVTNLTPTISISDNATISPDSGVAEDFTNPITYTITAQDGSTQDYTVTVTGGTTNQSGNSTSSTTNSTTTTQSSDKVINSFSFDNLNPEVDGKIDNTNYAITLTVPSGIDVTDLTPTISISDNATISPDSDVTEDFTNPITYTVTAQDGSTQDYTVTVKTATGN